MNYKNFFKIQNLNVKCKIKFKNPNFSHLDLNNLLEIWILDLRFLAKIKTLNNTMKTN
jgi:hypothetical protein